MILLYLKQPVVFVKALILYIIWPHVLLTGVQEKNFTIPLYVATKNLLEEASGRTQRFVYISSVVATGLGPKHRKGVRENDPVYKTGIFYGDAKLDAEGLV